MDKALIIAAALVLLLGGCTLNSAKTGSLCTAGPIILDDDDALTRGTAEQIVTLNESGESICGWKSPK